MENFFFAVTVNKETNERFSQENFEKSVILFITVAC